MTQINPEQNEKDVNAANAAYAWQSPQASPVQGNSRLKLVGLIIAGVVIFLGLAVLLAFI